MSDIVERVARAILAAHDFTKNDGKEGGWETLTPDWQDVFRDQARAAIEAMREPTDGMRTAGAEAELPASYHEPNDSYSILGEPPDPIWYAMIDAALTTPAQSQ